MTRPTYKPLLLLFFSCFFIFGCLNPLRSHSKKGNKLYGEQKYSKSLHEYDKALQEDPFNADVLYNRGSAQYQLKNYPDAITNFNKALSRAGGELSSKINYNLGNAHFHANDYQKAVESFQESLRLNPGDKDTIYNLELARKKMRENANKNEQNQSDQTKDKKSGKNDDKNKNNQKNKESKDNDDSQKNNQQNSDPKNQQPQNDPKDKEESGQKKEGDKSQNKNEKGSEQSQAKKTSEVKQIPKEDAEQLLRAMDDKGGEKKKYYKFSETAPSEKVEKNW